MSQADIHWMVSRPPEGGGGGERTASPRGVSDAFPFGRRVLITEDNWLIASEWEAALLDAGYEVTGIAVSADEAVRSAVENAPDFVIMDIRLLGQKDGVDAALELRERLDLPAVFVSAHNDPEMRERAAPARPLGWIVKPVTATRFPEMLSRLAEPRN